MEPLNGIETLIDEPGFAALLKERIASAKEKYAALEKAAGEFESENLRLKLENLQLHKKVENLERQLAQRQA
jgi:hypothetical protein